MVIAINKSSKHKQEIKETHSHFLSHMMVYTIGIVIIAKFAYDSNLAERLQMLLVHLSRAGIIPQEIIPDK